MRRLVASLVLTILVIALSGCSSADFSTPSCDGEPSEEQINKYICAECDGYRYLQVVCNNNHLDCPVEARGKVSYKVVKYDDWKNARGDCIMAQ